MSKKEGKKSKSNLRPAVERRKRAAIRKAAADKRTPVEQLARLDAAGMNAVKERLKLHMRIQSVKFT